MNYNSLTEFIEFLGVNFYFSCARYFVSLRNVSVLKTTIERQNNYQKVNRFIIFKKTTFFKNFKKIF